MEVKGWIHKGLGKKHRGTLGRVPFFLVPGGFVPELLHLIYELGQLVLVPKLFERPRCTFKPWERA